MTGKKQIKVLDVEYKTPHEYSLFEIFKIFLEDKNYDFDVFLLNKHLTSSQSTHGILFKKELHTKCKHIPTWAVPNYSDWHGFYGSHHNNANLCCPDDFFDLCFDGWFICNIKKIKYPIEEEKKKEKGQEFHYFLTFKNGKSTGLKIGTLHHIIEEGITPPIELCEFIHNCCKFQGISYLTYQDIKKYYAKHIADYLRDLGYKIEKRYSKLYGTTLSTIVGLPSTLKYIIEEELEKEGPKKIQYKPDPKLNPKVKVGDYLKSKVDETYLYIVDTHAMDDDNDYIINVLTGNYWGNWKEALKDGRLEIIPKSKALELMNEYLSKM